MVRAVVWDGFVQRKHYRMARKRLTVELAAGFRGERGLSWGELGGVRTVSWPYLGKPPRFFSVRILAR